MLCNLIKNITNLINVQMEKYTRIIFYHTNINTMQINMDFTNDWGIIWWQLSSHWDLIAVEYNGDQISDTISTC